MKNHVLIVGGGASGMMAAISAARAGAQVSMIEHNDRVGKKILSTGNGKCNYTNLTQSEDCYRSNNLHFPWRAIELFDATKTVEFFEELGIMAKNKNNYLYPYSEQASSVLDVLRMEVERLKVQVVTEVHIDEISKIKNGFRLLGHEKDKKKFEIKGDKVILATGSKAASKLGADGSGYKLAQKLGHRIVTVVPALVQLKCEEKFYPSLAGVRMHGKVSVMINDRCISDTGEIQLTAYGISGIPVFQISRYVAGELTRKKSVNLVLDLMPEMTYKSLRHKLRNRMKQHPERTMDNFFTGVFNKKVSNVLLKISGISLNKKCGDLDEKEIDSLCQLIKTFNTKAVGTNPFEQAQICAGGIDTKEINNQTMESRLVKGLYFAGEVMDVDGLCGGYNLQWAWTSGYLAGKEAANA